MSFDKETIAGWLRDKVHDVTFTKKDGTVRVMTCTLDPALIPQITESDEMRAVAPRRSDVISVWSVKDNGWRSFRLDSIIKVQLTQDTKDA